MIARDTPSDRRSWLLTLGAACGSLSAVGCGQTQHGSSVAAAEVDGRRDNLSSYVLDEVWLLYPFRGAAFHARISGTVVVEQDAYRVVSFVALPAVGISQAGSSVVRSDTSEPLRLAGGTWEVILQPLGSLNWRQVESETDLRILGLDTVKE
jgi:hypothetical protein